MGARRIFNIIVVTSTFWFSVTVLVLMFSSDMTRESLTMLNAPVVLPDSKNHKYMIHAGVKPLQPNAKHIKYPWEKDFSEEPQGIIASAKVMMGVIPRKNQGSQRKVYDASIGKMKDTMSLGEGGKPAFLPSEVDKKLAEKFFANHSFNWLLSDRISLDRTLEDVRSER
jgi:polypeptide N-acetylgalactosaminyltransferase